jgi:hypothetical protein
MKMEQSVPKRRHIKFRRRGITQKKAYKNEGLALPISKRKQILGIPIIIELYLSHTSGSEMRRYRVSLNGIFKEILSNLLLHIAR